MSNTTTDRTELERFARLVRDMRRTQKEYFAGDKSVIHLAKQAERLVDERVAGILGRRQGRLF